MFDKSINSFLIFNFSDKWTREQILAKLEEFWQQNSEPVNMERFDFRNKFVFAGVFAELLGE